MIQELGNRLENIGLFFGWLMILLSFGTAAFAIAIALPVLITRKPRPVPVLRPA